MARTQVVQPKPPAPEVAVEIIADSIVSISDGIKRLRSGRLNEKALMLLIQSAAPGSVSQKQIKAVLQGIENLRSAYLRKAV